MHKTILFALFFVAFQPIGLYSQSPCPDLDSLVNAIQKANYFKEFEYRTGFGEFGRDSQYLRAATLTSCATEDQLRVVLTSEYNIVALYGWLALMQKQPEEALQYLIKTKELKKRTVTEFLNSCQGDVEKAMADVMAYQLYHALLQRKITLSANSMVDFLNFKEDWMWEKARERWSKPDGKF
jgi:hypothetical protein